MKRNMFVQLNNDMPRRRMCIIKVGWEAIKESALWLRKLFDKKYSTSDLYCGSLIYMYSSLSSYDFVYFCFS